MIRKILFIVLFCLTTASLTGQTKLLSIEEAVLGRQRLSPKDMMNIQWRDPVRFSYLVDYTEIVQLHAKTNEKLSIVNVSDLNKLLLAANQPVLPYLYQYRWSDASTIIFESEQSVLGYNVESKTIDYIIVVEKDAKNLRFCNENKTLAFTVENNLFIKDKDGLLNQVTSDTNKGIVNGDAYVHRQEFGIDNGIFWSPDGSQLAFYRKDESMVANYPLVNISTRIASLNNIKYPMAGEISEEVTLGVYNLKTKKTIFLKTGEPRDAYLARVTWDPSGNFIYITQLNRGQDHLKLNKYDAQTGEYIATLFEEKDKRYVEPENDMFFLKSKPNLFVWQSERDGFKHLYLYDNTGKLIKQLTKGNFVIAEFLGFDMNDENFFVVSTMESPIERHLYRYNLKSGKYVKLTRESGENTITLSPDHKYFVSAAQSKDIPRLVQLIEMNGKPVRELLKAENPLKDYKLGELSLGTIKSADDKTDLHYRMIKPVGFDPSKKYPVILYVYGGPHSQLVKNTWLGGASLWDLHMASKGYLVFTLDNRGTAYRGFEFESIIHRQLGVEEVKDQIRGLNFLKSLPFVDKERIGVYGWSYGGFMSISMMTDYPAAFKVGVAGGPVTDWKYYEAMYGERYMDTPLENPEGYAKTSLLSKAKYLKGRLLIIHGTIDPVVVWQHSQDFVKSCVDNGVLVDYAIYPGHEHNVMGKDRLHLKRKITQYFDDFLK
jgi:dipeptidyl-peptidase 4